MVRSVSVANSAPQLGHLFVSGFIFLLNSVLMFLLIVGLVGFLTKIIGDTFIPIFGNGLA